MFRTAIRALSNASLEVFLAFLSILGGLPILLSPGVYAPASILALLPLPLVFVFGADLVLGGTLVILGIMFKNNYVNRAGLIILSSSSFVMALSIVAITGVTRLFIVGTYLLFSWSLWARYQQLGELLKERRQRWTDIVKRKEE